MNRREKSTILLLSIALNVLLIITVGIMYSVYQKKIDGYEKQIEEYKAIVTSYEDSTVEPVAVSYSDVSDTDEAAATTALTTATTATTTASHKNSTRRTEAEQTQAQTQQQTAASTAAPTTQQTSPPEVSGDNDAGWIDGWY